MHLKVIDSTERLEKVVAVVLSLYGSVFNLS